MDFGIAGVAAITVIAYLIGSAVKATALDNKWIPIICGAAGGILGALAMRIMPDFPATDYITAVPDIDKEALFEEFKKNLKLSIEVE